MYGKEKHAGTLIRSTNIDKGRKMNSVTVVGNLTRDPELRVTTNGKFVATFGLAENYTSGQGEQKEEHTNFFDVKIWGPLAENVAKSLTKGARVHVSGRLAQETWDTKDGERRSKVLIVANEVSPSLTFATVTITKTPFNNSEPVSQHSAGVSPSAPAVEDPF